MEDKIKLNFTVEIEENDEYFSLQEEIVEKASERFIREVLGNSWDKTDLYERLEKSVIKKLEDIMDIDFKTSVAEKVTENLSNKFEKSKQYKSLLVGEEIVSDSVMKSGLRDLIAEVVRSEMKKMLR